MVLKSSRIGPFFVRIEIYGIEIILNWTFFCPYWDLWYWNHLELDLFLVSIDIYGFEFIQNWTFFCSYWNLWFWNQDFFCSYWNLWYWNHLELDLFFVRIEIYGIEIILNWTFFCSYWDLWYWNHLELDLFLFVLKSMVLKSSRIGPFFVRIEIYGIEIILNWTFFCSYWDLWYWNHLELDLFLFVLKSMVLKSSRIGPFFCSYWNLWYWNHLELDLFFVRIEIYGIEIIWNWTFLR